MPRIEGELATARSELLQSQKQAAEQHEAAAVANARLEDAMRLVTELLNKQEKKPVDRTPSKKSNLIKTT